MQRVQPKQMLAKIISGGQTGADQAAWRAAAAHDVPTAGWMPQGFLTEAGPRPEFARSFGAVEMPSASWSLRSRRNVQDSEGTLWFGETTTSGALATVSACQEFGKPCLPIDPCAEFEPSHVADWILQNQIKVLNVAGNRESSEPGIGARVEQFMGRVLQLLGHVQQQ